MEDVSYSGGIMQAVAQGVVNDRSQEKALTAARIAKAVDRDGFGVFVFVGAQGRRRARRVANELGEDYIVTIHGGPTDGTPMPSEHDFMFDANSTKLLVRRVGNDKPMAWWSADLAERF